MERIVVGISGASGTPLACRLMRQLKNYTDLEVHAVVSQGARITAGFEAPEAFAELEHMVDRLYDNDAIGSSIASGTFQASQRATAIICCFAQQT